MSQANSEHSPAEACTAQAGQPQQASACACTNSACQCFKEYARQRPEVVALWCFGIGFVLGWKLRR
jgi:hypothetical protein